MNCNSITVDEDSVFTKGIKALSFQIMNPFNTVLPIFRVTNSGLINATQIELISESDHIFGSLANRVTLTAGKITATSTGAHEFGTTLKVSLQNGKIKAASDIETDGVFKSPNTGTHTFLSLIHI